MAANAFTQITVAVTPAVMVSTCALIALGLDNQVSRMSMRLRDLAHEFRRHDNTKARRSIIKIEVKILGKRHKMLTRALVCDYAALLAFVLTSLLSLTLETFASSPTLPLTTFTLAVLFLIGTSLFTLTSLQLAGAALKLEQDEILGATPHHED